MRSRSENQKYETAKKEINFDNCQLCGCKTKEIVQEVGSFRIMKNAFGYAQFDHRRVEQHLMILPVSHKALISDLTKPERLELVDLMAKYEAEGYNLFSRSGGSTAKSIPGHFHLHLIKTTGRPFRALLYLSKPYLMLFGGRE